MADVRIAGIQYDSIVDGPGLRTAIYVQGCLHKCDGCHNPETWNMQGGKPYSCDTLYRLIIENSINKNVTFSGGDPVYQYESLYPLIEKLKYNQYHLVLYTGFTVSELLDMCNDEIFSKFIIRFDMVISDRYIKELDTREKKYRGSSNQPIGKFMYDQNDMLIYTRIPEEDI